MIGLLSLILHDNRWCIYMEALWFMGVLQIIQVVKPWLSIDTHSWTFKKTWTHLDMLTILDPKFFVDGFGPIWRQTYDLPKNCDKLGSRGARGAPVDPNWAMQSHFWNLVRRCPFCWEPASLVISNTKLSWLDCHTFAYQSPAFLFKS